MDRFKKFLTEKKVAKNFKKAGTGHRLTDTKPKDMLAEAGQCEASPCAGPSSADRILSADIAVQAAYKRMNLDVKKETISQRSIRTRALRELEEEKRVKDADSKTCSKTAESFEKLHVECKEVVENVYYTCELLDDDIKLTKKDMRVYLESFLRNQLNEDAVVASVLMLFSLNGSERCKLAVETLQKYLINLIENPDNEKFRQIRLGNKALQERVLSVIGGREFLEACGFEQSQALENNSSSSELFFVISVAKATDIASLLQALEMLQSGQRVPLKLHRDPIIYKIDSNQGIGNLQFAPEFYHLSVAEVKAEQSIKERDAEKLLTLRTREMRERDDKVVQRHYKYSLVRIRFPNDYILQGTFSSEEPFSAVRMFVTKFLSEVENPVFDLIDASRICSITDYSTSLSHLHLVPAAMLLFDWDKDVKSSMMEHSSQVSYLHERYMSEAIPFPA